MMITLVKRMAAEQAAQRQPSAFESPVFGNGFLCILGASWGKPTGGRCVGRDMPPIKSNERKKNPFHLKIPAFSARER